MSSLELGRKLENDFDYNNCVKDADIYVRMGKIVHFDVSIILQALTITAAITTGLTLYTMQTKRDFSSWGACIGALLMAVFLGGITNVFFGSPAIHLALSIAGAFIFACLLIFDTQMIMQRFSAEEYIAASITLYLDILNLFLYILRILQATNNN
ncbi:unnamed protein product [Mesocestoides corti]|uniref:Transmembrane BAX inhibitor motif-containing protein 4 n=1 Tax=Mesocestoides corti TaxID=53468 RepID=A0A0R3U778_MESCO|nr:unnamed protein product [Mesocestoides corti]